MKVKDLENLIFCDIEIYVVTSAEHWLTSITETLFNGYFYEIPSELLNENIKYVLGSCDDCPTIRICIEK